jgi:hypothetical protein
MASTPELRREQTERLFDLLRLKRENEGYEVKCLDEMIRRAKASMTQEDVSWVEKLIAEGK